MHARNTSFTGAEALPHHTLPVEARSESRRRDTCSALCCLMGNLTRASNFSHSSPAVFAGANVQRIRPALLANDVECFAGFPFSFTASPARWSHGPLFRMRYVLSVFPSGTCKCIEATNTIKRRNMSGISSDIIVTSPYV